MWQGELGWGCPVRMCHRRLGQPRDTGGWGGPKGRAGKNPEFTECLHCAGYQAKGSTCLVTPRPRMVVREAPLSRPHFTHVAPEVQRGEGVRSRVLSD